MRVLVSHCSLEVLPIMFTNDIPGISDRNVDIRKVV